MSCILLLALPSSRVGGAVPALGDPLGGWFWTIRGASVLRAPRGSATFAMNLRNLNVMWLWRSGWRQQQQQYPQASLDGAPSDVMKLTCCRPCLGLRTTRSGPKSLAVWASRCSPCGTATIWVDARSPCAQRESSALGSLSLALVATLAPRDSRAPCMPQYVLTLHHSCCDNDGAFARARAPLSISLYHTSSTLKILSNKSLVSQLWGRSVCSLETEEMQCRV